MECWAQALASLMGPIKNMMFAAPHMRNPVHAFISAGSLYGDLYEMVKEKKGLGLALMVSKDRRGSPLIAPLGHAVGDIWHD